MLTFEEWRHTYADIFETDDAARAAWTAACNRGYRTGMQDTRALLAAYNAGAQEPVAWMRSYRQFSDTQSAAPDPGHMVTSFHQNAEFAAKYPDENTPLYAHPQPMPQAQPVYDKSVVRRLATQWGMIPEDTTADAERDARRLDWLQSRVWYRSGFIADAGIIDMETMLIDSEGDLRKAIDAEIERIEGAKDQ